MGEGKGIFAANFDWATAGAAGEEVADRGRETNAPQRDDREELCVVTGERDFVVEGQRLRASIDRFAAGGGATRQLVVEHHI
jgi:hypothetical protein